MNIGEASAVMRILDSIPRLVLDDRPLDDAVYLAQRAEKTLGAGRDTVKRLLDEQATRAATSEAR